MTLTTTLEALAARRAYRTVADCDVFFILKIRNGVISVEDTIGDALTYILYTIFVQECSSQLIESFDETPVQEFGRLFAKCLLGSGVLCNVHC